MKKSFLFIVGVFALFFDLFRVNHNAASQATSMALIKMSSIGITNLSGKAGGSVYSRNRGGSYIKNFVMPVNTFSAARQLVRATFGAISSGWRLLTEPQRLSFMEQTVEYPVINSLGDSVTLSGNALYVMHNKNLVNVGLAQITNQLPPQGTNALFGVAAVPVFDIGGGDEFTFQNSLQADNALETNAYILEATPAVSPSIKNVENKFRVLAKTTDDNGNEPGGFQISNENFELTGASLRALYEAKFGVPVVDTVIWFRMKAINPNTGEASAYFTQFATVSSTI